MTVGDRQAAVLDRLHGDLVLRAAGGGQDPSQDIATSEYVVVPAMTVALAAAMREAVAVHWRATWARDAAQGVAILAAGDQVAFGLIDVQVGSIDGVWRLAGLAVGRPRGANRRFNVAYLAGRLIVLDVYSGASPLPPGRSRWLLGRVRASRVQRPPARPR